MNSDEAFRACEFEAAWKRHKPDTAANEESKSLYKYQEKALQQIGKPPATIAKKDLDALVKFGIKLKDRNGKFKEVAKLKLPELRKFYTTNLQALVEDTSKRFDQPPNSIPEPDVPSLEQTRLAKERARKIQTLKSIVLSADDSRQQQGTGTLIISGCKCICSGGWK